MGSIHLRGGQRRRRARDLTQEEDEGFHNRKANGAPWIPQGLKPGGKVASVDQEGLDPVRGIPGGEEGRQGLPDGRPSVECWDQNQKLEQAV